MKTKIPNLWHNLHRRFQVFNALLIICSLAGCTGLTKTATTTLANTILWAVERHGSNSLNVEVSLGTANLSEQTGKGELQGLKIGNPEGFQTKSAFEVERIIIAIEPTTLDENVVIVKNILVKSPIITYELGKDGSNFATLHQRAKEYLEKHGVSIPEEKNLFIKNIQVRNGNIQFSNTWMDGDVMTVPLPDIHIENIGTKLVGTSPAELIDRLSDEFANIIEKEINNMESSLKNIKESVYEQVEKIDEVVENLVEELP